MGQLLRVCVRLLLLLFRTEDTSATKYAAGVKASEFLLATHPDMCLFFFGFFV